jgi:DNA repair exonuclease SbcCD ATPase subunit
MEETNPQGSQTVNDAAAKIFGMLEPEQPEGQAEEPAQEVQEYEAQAEDSEEVSEEVQEEVEETPRYRVKVDNEELEVDLDELIKGYSRTSDYTKKTQTLAEQRKAVEAERTKIEEAAKLRDTYAQRLQVIEQMLTQPEEDIAALKDQDPIGYAVKMAERMEREKQLQAVRAEREAVQAKQTAEHQERLKAHLSQEAERLKAAIPDLSDEVKGEVIRKEIRDYAKSNGWTDQELSQVYDHRAVIALYRAMQYEKLMKGKPAAQKKVVEAPKALKPGTGSQKIDKDSEQVKKLTKQLKQTGRPRDAAALFERFL